MRGSLPVMLLALLAAIASCGGGAVPTETGTAASAAAVSVTGHVAHKGTRGSILVFAYTDLNAGADPVGHEPASIAPLTADGDFDVSVPPSATLTLVFLADGSNDGVVDEGDPIATLTAPELADLQAGDRVHLGDATLDFHAHKVTAALDVSRASAPAHTPTPVP